VVEICKEHQFERVADLGCAELTFVQYLKNLDFITQVLLCKVIIISCNLSLLTISSESAPEDNLYYFAFNNYPPPPLARSWQWT